MSAQIDRIVLAILYQSGVTMYQPVVFKRRQESDYLSGLPYDHPACKKQWVACRSTTCPADSATAQQHSFCCSGRNDDCKCCLAMGYVLFLAMTAPAASCSAFWPPELHRNRVTSSTLLVHHPALPLILLHTPAAASLTLSGELKPISSVSSVR